MVLVFVAWMVYENRRLLGHVAGISARAPSPAARRRSRAESGDTA